MTTEEAIKAIHLMEHVESISTIYEPGEVRNDTTVRELKEACRMAITALRCTRCYPAAKRPAYARRTAGDGRGLGVDRGAGTPRTVGEDHACWRYIPYGAHKLFCWRNGRRRSVDAVPWGEALSPQTRGGVNMETSKNKICPLSARPCKESSCAWWHGLAEDCAVVLLAGMFADSGSISHCGPKEV